MADQFDMRLPRSHVDPVWNPPGQPDAGGIDGERIDLTQPPQSGNRDMPTAGQQQRERRNQELFHED
ncbi:hypothetical protein GJ654_16265 [Rhodoblastus acidophilus]|uniref:Uncharacterized protein n=1 Tax=Rhodoblastus acidophilus TaxID=1074 RepID=A0A6N8DTR2_RHOAC|nr:hypothetical protein [Rhodoblastus acidophilus]